MDRRIVEQLILGKGVNGICRELHVGKKRVGHIKEVAREHGYLDGTNPLPPYPEALFPDPSDGRSLQQSETDKQLHQYLEWIKEHLLAGWKPITVFEELSISINRSSFYRYLNRHKLLGLGESIRYKKAVQEIIYTPGEALLVDWGKLRDVTCPKTNKKKTLWDVCWSNGTLQIYDYQVSMVSGYTNNTQCTRRNNQRIRRSAETYYLG